MHIKYREDEVLEREDVLTILSLPLSPHIFYKENVGRLYESHQKGQNAGGVRAHLGCVTTTFPSLGFFKTKILSPFKSCTVLCLRTHYYFTSLENHRERPSPSFRLGLHNQKKNIFLFRDCIPRIILDIIYPYRVHSPKRTINSQTPKSQ